MPTRIRVPQRIVQDIAIPVQALRIPRLRHNRVRLQEPPRQLVVPAAIVPVHAQVVLLSASSLAGKALNAVKGLRLLAARIVAGFAPSAALRTGSGVVTQLGHIGTTYKIKVGR